MVTAIMLFTRSAGVGATFVDGVASMLAVVDEAVDTTAALQKARAVTLANAAGRKLPAGYFDQLSVVASGAPVTAATGQFPLAAVGDNVVFGRFQTDSTIASVAAGVEQEAVVND
jgi:hypothetical protein